MAFELFVLSSYVRCLKKLGSREQNIAGLVVLALQAYFETQRPISAEPYLFPFEGKSHRLVFKKLCEPFWEAYIEGQIRVVTRLEKNRHFLLLVGNHDPVRQFLKRN